MSGKKKGQMKENSTLNWEEYERKDLNKKLQMFCAEVCTKDGFFYNFVENNYYKQKIVLLLVHFVICGHSWCFKVLKLHLPACGSSNFENFKNITHAHISQNALALIRFSV